METLTALDSNAVVEPLESQFIKRNYNLTRDLDERLKRVVDSCGGLITETALVRFCLQLGLDKIERDGVTIPMEE